MHQQPFDVGQRVATGVRFLAGCLTLLLIYSLTHPHSPTHLLAHPLVVPCSPVQALVRVCGFSLTSSLTHSLTSSLTRSLSYSLTFSLNHSLTGSLTYLLTHSLNRAPTHTSSQDPSMSGVADRPMIYPGRCNCCCCRRSAQTFLAGPLRRRLGQHRLPGPRRLRCSVSRHHRQDRGLQGSAHLCGCEGGRQNGTERAAARHA